MMYGILFLGYWWFYRSGAKTAEAEKAKAAEATSNVFSLQLEPGKIVRGVRNFGSVTHPTNIDLTHGHSVTSIEILILQLPAQ